MGYYLECVTDTLEVLDTPRVAVLRPLPLADTLQVSDAVSSTRTAPLSDALLVAGTAGGFNRGMGQITDRVGWRDALSAVHRASLADTLVISDAVGGVTRYVPLRDTLMVSDAASGFRRAFGQFRDTLHVADSIRVYIRANVTDALVISDTAGGFRRHRAALADSLTVTESWGGQRISYGRLTDTGQVSDAAGGVLHAVGAVRDVLQAWGSVTHTGLSEAWVTCADNGAVSYWTLPPVKCAVFWRGAVTLATDDGLLRLDGTAPVTTRIETPWEDFGTDQKKRVAAVYFDGAADGAEVEVATGNLREAPAAYPYRITAYTGGLCRAVPGRGLEGRYWRLRVTSTVNHEIRSVSLDAGVSNRRL